MKKRNVFLVACLIPLVGIMVAFAGVDDVPFDTSVVNKLALTNNVIIRGELSGIRITLPTAMTCSVVVASSEGTIYSKTNFGGAAGTTYVPMVVPQYDSGGTALTNLAGVVYQRLTLASKVTSVITGVQPLVGTNTVVVRLNVLK
jgi:hypothetical protein